MSAPEDTDQRTLLEKKEVQRDFWDFAGRETDHEMPPEKGKAAQRRFRQRPAHWIVNGVHALAIGDFLDPLAQIFAGVIDRFVRPIGAAEGELVVTGSGSDNSC